MQQFYTFQTIRGIQAGREYYVTMCPLRLVPRLFQFDDEDLDPSLRSQRILNKARIPMIAEYLVNNPMNYVFSAITASVDAHVEYRPIDEDNYNMGLLQIPMSARFIVNDGQHRRAAIEAALKQNSNLGKETIGVVLFIDEGLKRSQQMFADLNRYSVRSTNSLNILYDNRDPLADVARQLSFEVPVFNGLTELEKTTISNRSKKLFTLSSIYKATLELLGEDNSASLSDQKDIAYNYWLEISTYLKEWTAVKEEKITAAQLRKDCLNAHAITLIALGKVGHYLLHKYPLDWKSHLERISYIDWNRKNKRWEGRVTIGGKISFSRNNLLLLTNEFKNILNLPLSEEEVKAEKAWLND